MATLIFAVALVALVASLVLLSQIWLLTDSLRVPGAGRIYFLSWLGLKVWILLVMFYFMMNSVWPQWFGDTDNPVRTWILLFFAVYLATHAVGANVALFRWRHQRSTTAAAAEVVAVAAAVATEAVVVAAEVAAVGRAQHDEVMDELRRNTEVGEALQQDMGQEPAPAAATEVTTAPNAPLDVRVVQTPDEPVPVTITQAERERGE